MYHEVAFYAFENKNEGSLDIYEGLETVTELIQQQETNVCMQCYHNRSINTIR